MNLLTLFSGDHKWCQHFWSANAGGAGAKPLLGLANTVQRQVRSGGGAKTLLLGLANTSVSGLG